METTTTTNRQATSPQYTQTTFQKWTSSAEVSPARHSAYVETKEDSKTREEHYSLTLPESLNLKNQKSYSLKMLKTYLAMTEEELSRESSLRFMNLVMMSNANCSTARISESRKTESACTLSDILEENVPDKYFLSLERQEQLLGRILVTLYELGYDVECHYHTSFSRHS